MFAYHGSYRKVDLSQNNAIDLNLDETILRRFIGGVGLGTYLLHRESQAALDPLTPEAPLIFALSPLVGTPLTTSAKFAVVAKSPLTQRLNDALSSSHFALAAKKAGFDALVIVGVCSEPAVLVIDDSDFWLEPASHLWGLSASEADEKVREKLGPDFHTAIIGPAGEKRVRYATISHENRHAGRGGLGAVMGSKNLKAVAVRGTNRTPVAKPTEVISLAKQLSRKSFGPATAKYRELGTVSNLLTFNRLAALPTRNFQQGKFEQAEELSGEELNKARRVARRSCAACTIGCEHIYEVKPNTTHSDAHSDSIEEHKTNHVRLEYESLFALGPLCGIGDKDVVLRAAQQCDHYGLDTISTGATIAFAMECGERGLLDVPNLCFGNADQLLATIHQIGNRQGVGDLLAEGTRIASSQIGGQAPDFAPHVKGLEIPGYEPRTLQTMALGFAVSSRGADHNRSGAYEADFSLKTDRCHGTPEAAIHAIETEDRGALLDSLILCKFLRGVFADLFAESAELLGAVTGWDVTADELRTSAKRIVTLKKLYNIREGWTRSEDTLPRRFLSEGIVTNQPTEARLNQGRLDQMIAAYYRGRDWNDDGSVPCELIERLGLVEV
ncbi:MAG: aldehyde ferredoxin oxidoreductase family protein [Gemmataceae bacterium]